MDGFRKELKSQIMGTINSVISEKVLPDIRNTIVSQHPRFRKEVDHRSSRLSRTAKEENIGNVWKPNSRPVLVSSNQSDYFREDSDASLLSDSGNEPITIGHDN